MSSKRVAALCAFLIPFGVYAACVPGQPGYWDTGEMEVVPWIFGVSHSTGFPVFVIAAGIFAHLFAIGSVAWRIGIFSALAMSGAAYFVHAMVVLLTTCHPERSPEGPSSPLRTGSVEGRVEPFVAAQDRLRRDRGSEWIGVGAAWIFAFGEIAWTRGTRAEVHDLALFFALLALYCALRWYGSGESRWFVSGAAGWGLGIATHPIVVMLAPAVAIIVAARLRVLRWKTFALGLAVFVLGLAFYAYIPLRSAAVTSARSDPTLALGIAPGRAFWDLGNPSNLPRFLTYMSGSDYGVPRAFQAMYAVPTYARKLPAYFEQLIREMTPLGLLFALGGTFALARTKPLIGWTLIAAAAFPTMFGFAYENEADRERYYLISFAIAAIFAGYGALRLARALPALRNATLFLVAVAAAALLFLGRDTFDQRTSNEARGVIAGVQALTPRNAILVVPWLDATPLAYAAYVERSLGDRIVDSAWLEEDAALVPRWVQNRPVYVVGTVFGEIRGYRLIRISDSPDLFRVVKR